MLRRVVVPEATPEGQFQRDPEELPIMMRYEVVENENEKDPGSVKIILLEDVEGNHYVTGSPIQLLLFSRLVRCSILYKFFY